MIALRAPALPVGAGVHCDASALPVQEMSLRLCPGTTAPAQPEDALAAGA